MLEGGKVNKIEIKYRKKSTKSRGCSLKSSITLIKYLTRPSKKKWKTFTNIRSERYGINADSIDIKRIREY